MTVVVLRLYVAGGAPNSMQAIANLEAVCAEYLKDGHRLEVVECHRDPRRAMADGVLVTPSLIKLSPRPGGPGRRQPQRQEAAPARARVEAS